MRRTRVRATSAAVVLTLDLSAEAVVMRAASAHSVPVPGVVHVCGERDGLREAIVLQFVAGEALGRKIAGDVRFAAIRPALAGQRGRILSAIHRVPVPQEVVLPVEQAREVLERYEALYRAIDLRRPVLERAFQHLRRHAPAAASRCFAARRFPQR